MTPSPGDDIHAFSGCSTGGAGGTEVAGRRRLVALPSGRDPAGTALVLPGQAAAGGEDEAGRPLSQIRLLKRRAAV